MKMTPLDRMTFELVEAGMVTEIRRPLYEPALSRLIEAGIVVQNGDAFEPADSDRVGRTNADGSSRLRAPKPAKERAPAKTTLGVRLEADLFDALFQLAEAAKTPVSALARDLLREAVDATPKARKSLAPARIGPVAARRQRAGGGR